MIKINVHSSLTRFTNDQSQLELPIKSTSNLLDQLCLHYDKLRTNILDDRGLLSPYVNIYVNGKNLNQLPDMPLGDTDKIDIVTALVGG